MEAKQKSVTDLKSHYENLHNSQKELATKKKAQSPAHRKGIFVFYSIMYYVLCILFLSIIMYFIYPCLIIFYVIAKAKKIFQKFDTDGSGDIDVKEFQVRFNFFFS